jgi:taurine dioxygenase
MAPDPTFTRCSRDLGAVVTDVKLADLSHTAFAQVRDALHERGVLFFPAQHLTTEEHVAFAERFGTVSPYPMTQMLGGTDQVSFIEDTAEKPPSADDWHTDVTWIAQPPAYAVLAAIDIPEYGGDTMWSSLFAAFDALSPTMQALCDGLRVRHFPGPGFHEKVAENAGLEIADRLVAAFPPVEHPLIRRHPVTGRRALFVTTAFMDQVVGMHRDESDALLDFLRAHAANPNFCVRWRWTPGDVAMWDEASTNHRALADHFPQYRRMRRCTVDGPVPV